MAAYALTEVSSGSDALGSMRTRAERKDDKYYLTGQKIWITNGSVADVICVFAVTDPAAGSRGVSAFVVEKNSPGFSVGKKEKKMGIRGSPTVELIFDNCEVPVENRLGEEGEGFKIAMRVLDKSRPGSRRKRSASPPARSSTRPTTRRNASRSANRSASIRASGSCSPI